jgi:hypothetical protein
MSPIDVRCDPLTGIYSVHPDLSDKPFPTVFRDLPFPAHTCVLCRLTTAEPNDEGEIFDATTWRPITLQGPTVVTVPNRWLPFGDESRADLVIVRRHTTCVEDLIDTELVEFFTQLLTARAYHQRDYSRTLVFINVGQSAGSSQPHLHGQVVSTDIVAPAPITPILLPEAINEDLDAARSHDLIVNLSTSATTYVAYAPSRTGEIRVTADSTLSLAHAVQSALERLSAEVGEMSYNIILHVDELLVAQILPHFVAATIYPQYLGVDVITVPPSDLARRLRGSTSVALV